MNPTAEPQPVDSAPTLRSGSRRAPLSIRWVVALAVVISAAAGIVAIGISGEREITQALTAEVKQRLSILSHDLASSGAQALLGDYPELTLFPLIRSMQERDSELVVVVVTDRDHRIRGHRDARRVDTELDPYLVRELAATNPELGGVVESHGLILATMPIYQKRGEVLVGWALVGMRTEYVQSKVQAARVRQFVIVALILIACGTVVAWLSSFLLRPISRIHAGLDRIAAGDLTTPLALSSRTEFGVLANTIDEMRESLRQAQMESLVRERLARELELARELQQSLIPVRPIVSGDCAVVGAHRPAYEVGGDYYDALQLADGRVAVAVVDVAGKGLRGCLVTTMVASLVRSTKEQFHSPAAMLAWLDGALSESLPGRIFVTMLYGILDPAAGRFLFASAGHCPVLVRRADGSIEQWKGSAPPLGLGKRGLTRSRLRDDCVELAQGDKVLLYTDGVTEAMHYTRPEQFGLERVIQLFKTEGELPAERLIERQLSTLDSWSGANRRFDDETVVVVERLPQVAACDDPGRASAFVALAERRGQKLELPCRVEDLEPLTPWIKALPELEAATVVPPTLLGTAVYEICANAAEHGTIDPASKLDIWWVPSIEAGEQSVLPPGARVPCFLVRDRGKSYSPHVTPRLEFASRTIRRRGRGFGLDIVNRTMQPVVYLADTPEGNLTILVPKDTVALERAS